MHYSKIHGLLLTVLICNCFSLSAQWEVTHSKNFNGSYNTAYMMDQEKTAFLTLTTETRGKKGYILIEGLEGSPLNLASTDKLNYNEFSLILKFDEDPTIYYLSTSRMVIKDIATVIYLSREFDLESNTHFDYPQIGINLNNPEYIDTSLSKNGVGMISSLEPLIKKLKTCNVMYVRYNIENNVHYSTFSLDGSSKAINSVFKPKFSKSQKGVLMFGVEPFKEFYNPKIDYSSSNMN